ncbi:MAG: M24 family metallopeptidase [Rhodothermia bacterium]
MLDLYAAQHYMKQSGIDAWLMYDFRGNNPVMWQALGEPRATSRRNYLFIPMEGDPVLVVHTIDRLLFDDSPFFKQEYLKWREMQDMLEDLLRSSVRVAMEYSEDCALPMHAFVDAGTVELIRSFGKEVVSSADLFQVAAARWSDESVRLHEKACVEVLDVKDRAFDYIRDHLGREDLNEYEVQQFIRGEFEHRGLITDHGPIVGVNAHSGDPHFEPSAEEHDPIRPGDWILIDLWAKYPEPEAVYCDVTFTGYAGDSVPAKNREIFDIVTGARDAAIDYLTTKYREGAMVRGFEVDDVTRQYIRAAGYGDYFRHRTGHSMGVSPSPHALGANIDNLETHDTRELIAGVGFSIEPGVYLPEFGVRSEVDVFMHPDKGPVVTTEIQRDIILLG